MYGKNVGEFFTRVFSTLGEESDDLLFIIGLPGLAKDSSPETPEMPSGITHMPILRSDTFQGDDNNKTGMSDSQVYYFCCLFFLFLFNNEYLLY